MYVFIYIRYYFIFMEYHWKINFNYIYMKYIGSYASSSKKLYMMD